MSFCVISTVIVSAALTESPRNVRRFKVNGLLVSLNVLTRGRQRVQVRSDVYCIQTPHTYITVDLDSSVNFLHRRDRFKYLLLMFAPRHVAYICTLF